MDEKDKCAVDNFLSVIKDTIVNIDIDLEAIDAAANMIEESEKEGGRVHVSGIGKSAYVAGYAASLLSSTGSPSYYLHGTEAVHGSSGQLVAGDVLICISNSGETSELLATTQAAKNNGAKIIGVSRSQDSTLSKLSDLALIVGVEQEGGPLNRAPRASVLMQMVALQLLSVVLQSRKGLTPQQYVLRRPGGALGKLREGE